MEISQIKYMSTIFFTYFGAIYCNVIPTPKVYDKAHMFALAVRIRSKILQPFGLGTDLLTDMQNYIKELEEVTKGVNEENPEALSAVNRLENQGGPYHLLLRPIDTKSLALFYKWDEYTVKMFEEMFEQTLHRWNDLRVTAGLASDKNTEDSSPSSDSNF